MPVVFRESGLRYTSFSRTRGNREKFRTSTLKAGDVMPKFGCSRNYPSPKATASIRWSFGVSLRWSAGIEPKS
jgi:hypothetical protein